MHLLIAGSRGQLGQTLQAHFSPSHRVTLWSRPAHDIADPACADWVADLRPDVVINAAAWTNVDGAEAAPDVAFAANALGPKYLAEGCARCGAVLVQISSNEVFSGENGRFYREYEEPGPRTVYARSKAAGERSARQVLERLYIVRVAWLYGPGGSNFPPKLWRRRTNMALCVWWRTNSATPPTPRMWLPRWNGCSQPNVMASIIW